MCSLRSLRSLALNYRRAKRATLYDVHNQPRDIYIYIKKKAFKINANIENVGLNED